MSDVKDKPEPGSPEFDEWLRERIKERATRYFEIAEELGDDLEASGVLSGSLESVTDSDAEAFPDELDEYQPHERAKVISSQDDVPEEKRASARSKKGNLKSVK